ncbi:MAG: glycosyltransferase, partial [Nitrospinota bacterium]
LYDRHFSVLFFGTYLPLHGIDYILKAANLLKYDKEISFTLVGNGPGYKNMRSLATELGLDNTHFVTEWTEEETLMAYIRHASICLGIFGDTLKAARVIPCKVFNCLRQGKPIVTGDSQAARELLTHKKDAYLCSQADEKSIAKAIKALKNDLELRIAIGENALKTYKQQGSPEAIGKHLGEEITKRVFARGPER